MTTSMFDKERAKKFRVFRNGDPLFFGKDVVLSRQHAKTWDVFLEKLTVDIHNPDAVRDLCTPTGGTPVRSFDELEDRQNYVAVGRSKFKDIGYLTLGEQHTQQLMGPKKNDQYTFPPKTVQRAAASDARPRLHELSSTDVISIFVYANGEPLQPAKRINLTRRNASDLNLLMTQISQQVRLNSGAARLLYTVDGKLVYEPGQQLENRGHYVAVGSEFGGFKQLKYGSVNKPVFSTYSNNKKSHNGKSEGGRETRHYNGYHGSDSNSTSASSSIPADVWKNNRRGVSKSIDVESNVRMYRYENNRLEYVRHSISESPGRDPFHAKPRPVDRTGGDTYRQVDYDRDEGGIFKSKRRNGELAEQVQENYETRIDLPIDHLQAKQIQDEDEELSSRRRLAPVNGHGQQQQRQPKQPPGKQQQQLIQRTSKPGQPQRRVIQKQTVYDRVDDEFDGDDDDEQNKDFINRNNVNKKDGAPAKPHQVQGQGRRPPPSVTNGHGSATGRSVDSDDAGESQQRRTGKQLQEKKEVKRLGVNTIANISHRKGNPDEVTTPVEDLSPRYPTDSKPKTKKNALGTWNGDQKDSERHDVSVAKNGVQNDEHSRHPNRKHSSQNGNREEESDNDTRQREPHQKYVTRNHHGDDQDDQDDRHDKGEDVDDDDDDDNEHNSKRHPVVAAANRKQFEGGNLTKTVKRVVKETRDERSADEDDNDEQKGRTNKRRPLEHHEDEEHRNGFKGHDENNEDDHIVRKHGNGRQGQGPKKVVPRDDDEDERITAEDVSHQMTRKGRDRNLVTADSADFDE